MSDKTVDICVLIVSYFINLPYVYVQMGFMFDDTDFVHCLHTGYDCSRFMSHGFSTLCLYAYELLVRMCNLSFYLRSI